MEPLMPTVTGRSRPWTDHRLAVEGMAWKYRAGAPWRDVPERFGKWNSTYKRFNRWAENGIWEKLLAEGLFVSIRLDHTRPRRVMSSGGFCDESALQVTSS